MTHLTVFSVHKKWLGIVILLMFTSVAFAADSTKEKMVLSKKVNPLLQLDVGVYQGYDDGKGCNTNISQSEITLIDENKDRKEPISFCLKVTNSSQAWLANILLKGIKPVLSHTDFLTLSESDSKLLAPDASMTFYTEYLLEDSFIAQFIVEADIVDKAGNPLLLQRSIKAAGIVKTDLIVAPPIVNKTVLPKGGKGMLWELELVSNSEKQATDVEVLDPLPENTIFEAMPAGDYVSESGIYCKAEGQSYTEICQFEGATTDYPRGRIVWKGKIASDFSKSLADAKNKVIIRFVSNAPDAEIGDMISSQARTLWGDKQNEVLSDNPITPDTPADATLYKIHKPIEAEPEIPRIPTLSQWGLLLLSLFLIGFVRLNLK